MGKPLKTKALGGLTRVCFSGTLDHSFLENFSSFRGFTIYMLKTEDRKVVQLYTSTELFDQFNTAVPEGARSDTIRGMILLYLQNGSFKKQVDNFVATHKTL